MALNREDGHMTAVPAQLSLRELARCQCRADVRSSPLADLMAWSKFVLLAPSEAQRLP